MSLTNDDLKKIKGLLDGTESRFDEKFESLESKLTSKIDSLETKLSNQIHSLDDQIHSLDKKIDDTKEEIIKRVNQEISDLSEINRAVFTRTDQLECRVLVIERKLGLSPGK